MLTGANAEDDPARTPAKELPAPAQQSASPSPSQDRLLRLIWTAFALATFALYVALVVLTGSGDRGLLWIVGFVVVGWPTLAIGVAAALISRRTVRHRPPSSKVLAVSMLAWGLAAMALEVSTTTDYVAATLLWMGLPTALASVAALVAGGPRDIVN